MHNTLHRVLKFVPVALAALLLTAPLGNTVLTHADTGGGTIIEGNFGGDPKNLNPIIGADVASQRVYGFLFPALVGIDPKTTDFVPNAPGALATAWKVSDDGKTYTFTLRKDMKWTDGQPVTAKDVAYTWGAINNKDVSSPLVFLADSITSVTAPDDQTVVIVFKDANCNALSYAGFQIIPSHLFKADFSDIPNSPFNTNPSVSSGVFNFKEFVPSERVTLTANPDYPDALDKTVKPEGWIYKVVKDQNVEVDQFTAGEINVIDSPAVSARASLRANAALTMYDFPGNSWDYVGYNLADPTNPQPGVDKDGKAVDQGHHPLFGDVNVRQALAHAVDVQSIIKGAVNGEGTQMASGIIPASWAFDKTLKPLAYDVATAKKMLDAAGFPVGPDGLRVAKGAKYAKDGTAFKFTLLTNSGNARRLAAATLIQDQLKQIGVTVDVQAIDFNTLLDTMNHEKYDAFLLGWRNSFPDDPDQTQLFSPSTDVLGDANSNITSYNNPAFVALETKALNVPGCKRTDRAAIYAQTQKMLQDDQPYMFLYVVNGEYGARKEVTGFDPLPSQPYWNVDTWTVKTN